MDASFKTFEMCCIGCVILCPRFSMNQHRNPVFKHMPVLLLFVSLFRNSDKGKGPACSFILERRCNGAETAKSLTQPVSEYSFITYYCPWKPAPCNHTGLLDVSPGLWEYWGGPEQIALQLEVSCYSHGADVVPALQVRKTQKSSKHNFSPSTCPSCVISWERPVLPSAVL